MGGPSGGNKGGNSGSADAPNTKKSKVSVRTKAKNASKKVIDTGKNLITARRKTAYNVTKAIPGEDKRLRKNRTDYRNYLASQGSTTPDFLKDDENLTSFETYDKLINYKPANTKSSSDSVTSPLNYADYLAEEKGNYNLKMAGNVGGMNNPERGRDARTGKSVKTVEQPKVASQMDNSDVKSDLITADKTAPTDVEMTDDELLLKRKRGKKTKTVLTSITGDNSRATLSKKALLGG